MSQLKAFLQSLVPMTDREFESSSNSFTNLNLKKGEYFVQEGKRCKHIAFIKRGTLRAFYLNENADEVTSCFCTELTLTTSYKSFILQQPSTLSIQALEDTELQIISYDALQALYTTSNVWQNIGRLVAEREYFIMEQYASVLNTETAKEKYLRLLKEQPQVIHKATVEDIASYLGVTRRTLSRIRKEIAG